MADFMAIADAIADRFAPGNVTPPVGQANIRLSTARRPNARPASPFVTVVWVSSSDIWESGRLSGRPVSFQVDFHLAPSRGDVARDDVSITSWAGVLRQQLFGQVKLGLGPLVTKSAVTDISRQTLVYAGDEWNGIRLRVDVWTSEPVVATP